MTDGPTRTGGTAPESARQRDGLLDLVGQQHVFDSLQDVLAAYRALPPEQADAPGDATSPAAD